MSELNITADFIGKVPVGNLDFLIFEEGDGERVYEEDKNGNGGRIGLCDYFNQSIYIHKGLKPQRKRRTLVHELTHAYLDAVFSYRERYTDEDVCDFMESHAFSIIETVNEIYPI